MRLRQSIIAILLSVLVLSGIGMTWVFRYQLEQQAAVADLTGAQKDMQRLLLALDQQIGELEVILGSWSNFTEFYKHAANPNAAFLKDDLSVESIQAGGFDWITRINAQGDVLDHREVPLADGSTPARTALYSPETAPSLKLAAVLMTKRIKGCALLTTSKRLAISCYAPLLPSDGSGDARGTVWMARWISPEMLMKVRAQTNLEFAFTLRPQSTKEPMEPSRATASFLSSDFQVAEAAHEIRVTSKVYGMQGRHIADVVLTWPRESLNHNRDTLQWVTLAMGGLIAITAVVLIFALDRLLIRRLSGIRSDLGRILEHETWDGRVSASRSDELTDLSHYINDMLDIIRREINAVKEQSLTDPLTRLANRRRFDMQLQTILSQMRRDGKTGALVLFDVDFFKRYNDIYGHPQGDKVLERFGECLRQVARRPIDLPVRLGGEEFAILMPLTEPEGARHCAQRACEAVQASAIAHSGNEAYGVVTVSAGLTMMQPDDTEETLYSRADAALYAAKHSGRNCVAER